MTNNAIEYLATVDAAGVSLTKPQNIGQRKAYGLNVNVSSQPTKTGRSMAGAIAIRRPEKPRTQQSNSGLVWNLNLNSNYKLPHNYTVQVNGNYQSGGLALQGTNTGFYWHSIRPNMTYWIKSQSHAGIE